jgi:hypothetical protein
MKNAFGRLLLLAGLTLLTQSPALADDEVVGMWSSLSRTKGGLGPQWIFTKDGNVTHTFGALVDFKYEVKGNSIKMTLLAPDGSVTKEVSTHEFSIDGDTLTENPRTLDQKQVMKRTSKPFKDTHPIVGEWTYKHYTGGPALMRYSRTGIVQLSVPFQALTGTYRTNQGTLTITPSDQKPVSYKYKRERDSLVLTDGEGNESKFLRFAY